MGSVGERCPRPLIACVLLSLFSLPTEWSKQFNAMFKVLSGPLVARKSEYYICSVEKVRLLTLTLSVSQGIFIRAGKSFQF